MAGFDWHDNDTTEDQANNEAESANEMAEENSDLEGSGEHASLSKEEIEDGSGEEPMNELTTIIPEKM
ncbi:hypothetical protein PRIPAC_82526 [Pristionchus pacificus]|uniref:Uncharacterized protein n=1 Tax=Pristionchus pacificus TaxID=54126 RepID=A0A2A6BID6_PRIPA|nr:hypothetical protein PRIPAC_82526 [Pristionchus pacificus]|eukprot:PDM65596.1 hypothetical protein PRIPAC_52538 [Pristionchus pacificus]